MTNDTEREEPKMYSVAEVATMAGVTRIYVQKAIERDRLKATKVGKQYVIYEHDYQAWNESRKNYNSEIDHPNA